MSSFIRSKIIAWAKKRRNGSRDPDYAHLGDSLAYTSRDELVYKI